MTAKTDLFMLKDGVKVSILTLVVFFISNNYFCYFELEWLYLDTSYSCEQQYKIGMMAGVGTLILNYTSKIKILRYQGLCYFTIGYVLYFLSEIMPYYRVL